MKMTYNQYTGGNETELAYVNAEQPGTTMVSINGTSVSYVHVQNKHIERHLDGELRSLQDTTNRTSQ